MKTILFFLLTIFFVNTSKAQTGFTAGNYYQTQYYIRDIPTGYPYIKYDYYGNYAGTYQLWQRAVWHQETGGSYVYVWNAGQWMYQWVNGSYWCLNG